MIDISILTIFIEMQISVHCDIGYDDNLPDKEILKTNIQRNIPKIADALVGDLQWYSQNARLVPGSIKINSVEHIDRNRFKMFYHFEWNLFSPCQDLNETITQREQVMFHILPGALVFDVIDNARPTAADEL